MILAAGRGERMMPLTAETPKPMLRVAGKPLLQYHIETLKRAGITELVINYAWCGEKIVQYFKNGHAFGVNIQYSDESSGALETAGGIKKALPLLVDGDKNNEDSVFIVINGDVFCDIQLEHIPTLLPDKQACIYLVDNPAHNTDGDFCLSEHHEVMNKIENQKTYTFSGIAIYRARFFAALTNNTKNIPMALGPMLREAADKNQLQGVLLNRYWVDIGTPERLAEMNERLNNIENNVCGE